MAEDFWFTALADGYLPADAELHAAASDFANVNEAWESDDPALLVWLAARLAPTVEDVRAAVATTAALVEQRLHHIDASGLTLAAPLAKAFEMAAHPLDREALRHAMSQASVHELAASSLYKLLKAAFQLTKVTNTSAQLPRGLPGLVASAVVHANGALGAYIAASGGPFAVLSGAGELVRSRHELIDGQIRARSLTV